MSKTFGEAKKLISLLFAQNHKIEILEPSFALGAGHSPSCFISRGASKIQINSQNLRRCSEKRLLNTYHLCPPLGIIHSDKIKLEHEVCRKFCQKIDAEARAALPFLLTAIPARVDALSEMRQHLFNFPRGGPAKPHLFFACWLVIRAKCGHLVFRRHLIPRSTLHFPVTGSGLAKMINGGSSKLVRG